jgi:hypothetical protein
LEELSPPEGAHWKFVVRLTSENDELLVEPISILRSEDKQSPVFQLAFDSLADGARQEVVKDPPTMVTAPAEDSFDDEVQADEPLIESFTPSNVALGRILTELNTRLIAVAETGTQMGLSIHREFLLKLNQDVHSQGLTALANSIRSIQQRPAAGILRTRYLSYLHTQATVHIFR